MCRIQFCLVDVSGLYNSHRLVEKQNPKQHLVCALRAALGLFFLVFVGPGCFCLSVWVRLWLAAALCRLPAAELGITARVGSVQEKEALEVFFYFFFT